MDQMLADDILVPEAVEEAAKGPTLIERINAAQISNQQPQDSIGINMGGASTECMRRIWYEFRWVDDPEFHDAETLRRFKTGRQYEEWLLEELAATGVDLRTKDPATGKQFRAELAEGWLRGRIDGLVSGLDGFPGETLVVECKSMNAANYRAIIKKGLKLAKPNHYIQCQLYMYALGLQRCLYLFANKDSDERNYAIIEREGDACQLIEARMLRIVQMAQPPARISEDPNWFQCKMCPRREVCHKGKAPRRNCRTCIFAKPEPGATWRCTKIGFRVGKQLGCGDHQFIEGLVPEPEPEVVAVIEKAKEEEQGTLALPF